MKQETAKIIFSLLSLIFLIIADQPSFALSPQEIAEKTSPSVISLIVEDINKNRKNISLGTGFFVEENIILTNLHVLFPETNLETHQGLFLRWPYPNLSFKRIGMEQEWCKYTILGIDYQNDLAILWIEKKDESPLHLAKDNAISIGDTVFAVGSPLGFEGTFSQGIVSGIRSENGNTRLQINTPLSPGSSGGPVLNSKGEVIGIVYSQAVGGQNLNFAIPIEYAGQLLLNSKEWIEIKKRGNFIDYFEERDFHDDPRSKRLSKDQYFYTLLGNGSREQFEYAIKTGSLPGRAGNDKSRVLFAVLVIYPVTPNPDLIKMLIEDGADVNWQEKGPYFEKTPLHLILESECDGETLFKITKLLLNAGANANTRDSFGEAPLFKAVRNKNLDSKVLALLLNAGALVIDAKSHGIPLLYETCFFSRDPEVVEMLIAAGCDPNEATNEYGKTPLMIAKSIEVAKVLLQNGADISVVAEDGDTPLFQFISLGSPQLISEGLEKGVDPNIRYSPYNVSLLHEASFSLLPDDVLLETLDLLVRAGSNVNARRDDGITPLHIYAGRQTNEEGLNFLLNAGADVNARTNEGKTVLHSVLYGNPRFVKILLDCGADVNAVTKSGKTPLMSIVQTRNDPRYDSSEVYKESKANDLQVIEFLIAGGAEVNARTTDGWTALMAAAHINGDLRVITKLLEAGADVNACSQTGWTPLLAAAANNNNPDVVLLLLNAGADVNAKTKSGKTALDLVQENPDLKNSEAYWKLHDAQF